MKQTVLNASLVFASFVIPLSTADAQESRRPSLLVSVFDKERSDKEDVIYFRNKDILRGTVLNETLGIDTPYGSMKIALRRCAGVSFEGSRANTEAIVSVNRNRITGIIPDRIIRFRIGTSGEEIEVRKEKVQFILLRRMNDELDFLDVGKSRDLFIMSNGDLLTGKPAESRIAITTDYGTVRVNFDEMRKVEMQGGENVTAVITKRNSDIMRGTLETEEITLGLDIGMIVEKVYKDKLAKVFVDHIPDEMLTHFGALQPVRGESDGALKTDPPFPAGDMPRELKIDLGQGVFLEMVLIPAGEFDMGSPVLEKGRREDEPFHRVRISRPFHMGKYEVTQAQWLLVMGENPSKFKVMGNPVETVSWEDCQKFLVKLGQLVKDRKFRLPTEAEWEYACRAGTATRFYFGDNDADLGNYAWFSGNSGSQTRPVGSKRPNPWGLYDMHGNVWEWCADWYGKYEFPVGGVVIDPVGPGGGETRVLRGGSWNYTPDNCRAANRYSYSPDYRLTHSRVACSVVGDSVALCSLVLLPFSPTRPEGPRIA